MKACLFLALVLTSSVCAAPRGHVIAVLGDSRTDGAGEAKTNTSVLAGLLNRARGSGAEAVFFTGDLVLGLEHEDSEGEADPEDIPAAGAWGRAGFVYDPKAFQAQIDGVAKLVSRSLGPRVPFYPLIGNHEAVGPDAVDRFARTFHIERRAPIAKEHLAYTVDVAGAHIVMLATDYFDLAKQRVKEHTMKDDQLDWLAADLAAHRDARWRFVMAHEPAFCWGPKARGLDKHTHVRDRFWQVLRQGKVEAFFCAHQHLYERTKHDGIWQVISGGAGAPLVKEAGERAFYHLLVLDLPRDGKVQVRVIDAQGKVRDRFSLAG